MCGVSKSFSVGKVDGKVDFQRNTLDVEQLTKLSQLIFPFAKKRYREKKFQNFIDN